MINGVGTLTLSRKEMWESDSKITKLTFDVNNFSTKQLMVSLSIVYWSSRGLIDF